MDKKNEEVCDLLLKASDLLYVLEVALDCDMQPTKDTRPYTVLVKLIKRYIADVVEICER